MSGDGDQRLRIILDQLAQLAGLPPPPPIPPAQMASPGSAIDDLLAALTAAGGVGVPDDNADAEKAQAEREAKVNEALTKFPANEQESAAQLAGVGEYGQMGLMGQMTQQLPQMASGVAGGIAGAFGGVLQQLNEIPQQLAQAGQQAMQMGMGALQHGTGGDEAADEAGDLLGGESEFGAGGELRPEAADSAGGGGGGSGTWGGTTPTAMLGPPPTPSAGTFPASSQTSAPITPSPPEPSTPRGGMGAMPMAPPGVMHGATGAGSAPKADTKRVVPPSVKNGAPVQGRITAPPPTPEVTKRLAGNPVATRRILLPDRDDDPGPRP